MTGVEIEKFAGLLRAKEMEICDGMAKRDEIAIQNASDVLDQVQLRREREFAIRILDRDSDILRQIRSAFSRIADGSYGICIHCEDEISAGRLAAVPWAAFCIHCQEKIDRREIAPGRIAEELIPAA